MATQFSGGTYVNYTYTSDGTINSFISTIQTQLTAAGWTVSSTTTGNILMKSATTPMGLCDFFRFKNNSATSVTVSIVSGNSYLVGTNSTVAGGYITPISGWTYKIIATKYWFLITQIGNYSTKSLVYGGVLYTPSFLNNVFESGILISNYYNDAGGSSSNIWRGTFGFSQNNIFNYQVTCNNAILDIGNNGLNAGTAWQCTPSISSIQFAGIGISIQNNFPFVLQWGNGDVLTTDPLISYAVDGIYSLVACRGQLYDATYVYQQFIGDSTMTFSGHNWYTPTHNNWYGSLFFATS